MVGETNNCIAYYYHTVHILYKITFLQRSLILILKKMDQVALLLIIQDFFLFKLQTFTQMKKKNPKLYFETPDLLYMVKKCKLNI